MNGFNTTSAHKFSLLLLCGTALIATPALAQDNSNRTSSSYDGLDEILVTAQRREQRLQDVPVAITAADAEALAEARVENIANISNISPSIQFRASNISSSSANVIIRGLGTTGNSRTFEGSVGIFIDGVYRTRAASALQNFLDVGSLQVLRGPQGTLFGKNTPAGAVLIESTRPNTAEVQGNVELGYGNYGALDAKGAVNVPINDIAALRFSAMYSEDEGYLRDPNTDRRHNQLRAQAYKAQLLIEPSSDFSMRLIADYSNSKGDCCYATTDFVDGPFQPVVDSLTVARGLTLPSKNPGDFEQTLSGPSRQRIEDYGMTLHVNANLGSGTLKSVTAMRAFNLTQEGADGDFSGADIFELDESFKSQFFSQELTYNGEIPSINADYVVGLFYANEKLDMTRNLIWGSQGQAYMDILFAGLDGSPPGTAYAAPGRWAGEKMGGDSTSYAGFGHLTVDLTDQLTLIGGLRYSIEKKKGQFGYSFYRPEANDAFRMLLTQPGPAYQASTTNKALSGTAGIQYRPSDGAMVYLTYNRGFKAGGVNIDSNAAGTRVNNPAEASDDPDNEFVTVPPLDPRFKPETVNSFELGAKFDYWDRRARTNIALFYNDISDLQVAQFVGLQFTVLNSQSAKTYGAEFESLFEITPSLTLNLDGIWLPHARYGRDANLSANLSGNRFRYASKFSGSAGLSLDQPMTSTLNLTGSVQYKYNSSQYINTASDARRGAVGIVNGNIGVKSPGGGWQIDAWVQNAFNKVYPTLSFNTPIQTGDENAYMGAPRTYGISLRSSF